LLQMMIMMMMDLIKIKLKSPTIFRKSVRPLKNEILAVYNMKCLQDIKLLYGGTVLSSI